LASNTPPSDSNNKAPISGVSRRQLLKSSSIVSLATFGSRILGLIRDVLVASYFGTRADAFFVAFKIPNLFRRFFAEGAFANAFVPVISEYKTCGSHAKVQHLVQTTMGSLCALLMPITLVGVLGAPLLVMLFAPGFTQHEAKFALTVDLLRITFPYLWLISLTAFAGAVLNTYQHFVVPAATPMILNLSMIGFTLGVSASLEEPLMALAWAVFSAGMIQLLIHLPKLHQLALLDRPKVNFKDPGVRKILRLMAPIVFGASVYQLNMLVDVFIASFLQAGSITWLYFSDRLVQLPLGMIAVALSVVILPNLSSQHAAKDPAGFSQTLAWAIRIIWLIGLPATIGLMLLAEPILTTLFLHGEMSVVDIQHMVPSLRAYALGLFAFMMIKVLAPGFFAQQDSATPVRIGIQAMALSIALNFPLAYWLDHVGLALSTSLGAMANMGLLYWTLTRKGLYQRSPAAGKQRCKSVSLMLL
jgi:putative peptidoglycan lipid II flippase